MDAATIGLLNNVVTGDAAARLMKFNGDAGCLRPWEDPASGKVYITINEGGKLVNVPLLNATASLRKDDWLVIDRAIVKAATERMKAVNDLRSKGLVYTVAGGMAKTILETEKMGDISDAEQSMSGLRQSNSDRPQFDLAGLPLPLVHKDFAYDTRMVMASRSGGSPLDTTTAELAGRKVAEFVEKQLTGTGSSFTWASYTIQGYTNFTNRLTKTMTAPTASGWTPVTTSNEILAMRTQLQGAYHYGPYVCYCSTAWDQYMDRDYSTSKGSNTLRERIGQISGIGTPETLDYLAAAGTFTIILVQMTSDVVRMVNSLEITTVQWETQGGMQLNFKVMTIQVPQIRADINSNTGICHGST